ncbi:MAG: hypothetical protein ABSG55_01695 [Dehalococcoidia bacterium]
MRASVLVRGRPLRTILLLPAAAILLLLASSCYTLHTENSWIRIQNMGSAAANIQIRYLSAQGVVVASESCPGTCPAIPPGGGWTFIEGRSASLPKGFIGSAVVTSDQPIAVLLAKDVDAGDGYYQTAGDTVSINAGAGKLYLPLVINKDGVDQAWNSRFAIQNMGGTTACATLVYTSNYSDSEVYWDPFNPAAGGTPQDGCPQGGIPIAAGGTLFRSYQTMGVPPNFSGSVRVDLYPNAQGTPPSQQFVVATTDVFNIDSHQLAGYSGFTSSDMGTSILLPIIERTAGGEWSTDFEVMNSDPSQPATVTLKITGFDGNNQPVTKSSSFAIQTSRQCFQDSDVANCLAAGDTLPQNFHDGSALITSNRPVGVVVSRSSNRGDVYTSYRGLRTDTAGTRVYLPLVDKNSSDGASRAGLNSWVQVATVDGGAANLTITYVSTDVPTGKTSYKIKINGSVKLLQSWETTLPASFTGSMIIDSDKPIVAVGDVIAGSYPGDTDLMYEGIAAP